jgi:hypothetical protein
LPIELATKAIDLFLIDGWKIVHRIILALLSTIQGTSSSLHPLARLRTLEYEEVLRYLKTFTREIDLDAVRDGRAVGRRDGEGEILQSDQANAPAVGVLLRVRRSYEGGFAYRPSTPN